MYRKGALLWNGTYVRKRMVRWSSPLRAGRERVGVSKGREGHRKTKPLARTIMWAAKPRVSGSLGQKRGSGAV